MGAMPNGTPTGAGGRRSITTSVVSSSTVRSSAPAIAATISDEGSLSPRSISDRYCGAIPARLDSCTSVRPRSFRSARTRAPSTSRHRRSGSTGRISISSPMPPRYGVRPAGQNAIPLTAEPRGGSGLLELAPAAGAVVRDDLAEHLRERRRVDRVVTVEGDHPGRLVVVAARDDALRVRHDRAVVQEDVDVVLDRKSTRLNSSH